MRVKRRAVWLCSLLSLFAVPVSARAQRVISITSPADGATVSGQITVATHETSKVSWINVFADGVWFASNDPGTSRPYSVQWDSTQFPDGPHTVSVTGYSSRNRSLGSYSIGVNIANGALAAPSPTPASTSTPVVTPAPTPTPTATFRVPARRTRAPTATNAATSVPSPTSTPTPVLTSTPGTTAAPTPFPTPFPAGGDTYYVAPGGNDSAGGTSAAPWRTIQHAVANLVAGQTAIVEAGNYVERVSINSAGTSAAPITLQAASGASVTMLGFSISGSDWVIDGFDISTQSNTNDGYGVYFFGAAAHDIVQNNYIHELCHEGIYMEPTVSYISAINNRIWRAEMAGAQVDGTNELIEGNEVWGTQQRPAVLGGIYSGCITPSGSDADGFRFFGQNHQFVHNYIHDIAYGTMENPNPHVDCFQTWGSSTMKVDNITFQSNWCRWPDTSGQYHAGMLEGTSGAVGTLVFEDNVFADMKDGLIIGEGQPSGVAVIKIWNNTFDHIATEAVEFNDWRSSADEVTNNIFFDVGAGGDSYMCLPGGSPVIEANDFYMRDGGRLGNYCSKAPYISLNPTFVNAGDSTGAGADYHLQSGSPIKDNGVTLSQVPADYDGTARPLGAGYSIGAFQK